MRCADAAVDLTIEDAEVDVPLTPVQDSSEEPAVNQVDVLGGCHDAMLIQRQRWAATVAKIAERCDRVGAKLVDLYRKDKTPKEAFEKVDLLKYSKDYYRKKGTGRPTKKDRRDIDEYYESSEPEDL